MSNLITITQAKPELVEAVTEFFSSINTPETTRLFSPHEFTENEAHRVCSYQGKDEYYFLISGKQILGYGMLRGWDEGYSDPSLGISVHPAYKGRGLGALLMQHLVNAARTREAEKIILKVKPENESAIYLYKKFGFEFTNTSGEYLHGILRLKP
jgi:ribosomal-protein-alanine N-acetyltransferase